MLLFDIKKKYGPNKTVAKFPKIRYYSQFRTRKYVSLISPPSQLPRVCQLILHTLGNWYVYLE
jgi:hypothetical protein